MNVNTCKIDGILLIEMKRFHDSRGLFSESYHLERYREAGISDSFVQDNHSRSKKNVLRGMHFQVKHPQAQIVTVLRGKIFDVVVDLRKESKTFGQWFGAELSEDGVCQMYMPEGFAHGFYVLSEEADLLYKVSRLYTPHDEGGIRWNDPELGIQWPSMNPVISDRDAAYPGFREFFKP